MPPSSTSSDEEGYSSGGYEDVCRTRWIEGRKCCECERCGYVSERRSNVGRHYRRIHCELDNPKKCICKKTFKTKGEYYEHCEVAHPNLRHSWYITKQKYKIGALKQKKLKTKRTSESVGHRVFNESRILRSSPRIQSLYSSKSINKDPEIIANQYSSNFTDEELSDRVERGKDSSATESGSEVQEKTVDKVITNEEISVKENVREIVENSCVTSVSDYGMNLHLTHLPLKKRLEVRKHLSDVTNTHLYNVTPSEKSDVSLNNNNIHIFNKNLDEEHRAFISHIDFDDLNAILNLKSLKSNH